MKVYNRKLAARIEENERQLTSIVTRLTSEEANPHIERLRTAIDADIKTLADAGYYPDGKRKARVSVT